MNQPPKPSWWGRNWKWFVPSGCLTLLLLLAGFVFLILSMINGLMRSAEPYQRALEIAATNTQVEASIGTPLEPGMFTMGNIQLNGRSGHADLAIPVSGPKGKGKIYVVSSKEGGEWAFIKLVAAPEGTQEPINLLEPTEEPE